MRQRFLLSAVSLAFAGLTVFLGYFSQRVDFQTFIAAYLGFFGLYAGMVFYSPSLFLPRQSANLLWLGIALRGILLFSIPHFSDDYARFLWDGHLSVAGIHPFVHPPVYFIDHQIFPPGISAELFGKLNSPEYYTVYPPVCQLVFALAALLFTSSELGGVFVMKLFLLACEIGSIRLLWQTGGLQKENNQNLSVPNSTSDREPDPAFQRAAIAYALNPLLIFEIVGNCHFEGAMIFFLLAGIAAIQQGKINQGAFWWALATASKILPIMFLPIVWRWLGWRKGLRFNLVFAAATLLLFAPLLLVLPNILESLDLYFQQFQFNASIYYLIRELGYLTIGWDIGEFSGPALGGLTVLGILLMACFTRPKSSLPNLMLFSLLLYLSLAATVQPWYITVPLALSLATRWRFAILWSGLAALSYSHYEGGGFRENYALITVEYILLWAYILWETYRIFVREPQHNSS